MGFRDHPVSGPYNGNLFHPRTPFPLSFLSRRPKKKKKFRWIKFTFLVEKRFVTQLLDSRHLLPRFRPVVHSFSKIVFGSPFDRGTNVSCKDLTYQVGGTIRNVRRSRSNRVDVRDLSSVHGSRSQCLRPSNTDWGTRGRR